MKYESYTLSLYPIKTEVMRTTFNKINTLTFSIIILVLIGCNTTNKESIKDTQIVTVPNVLSAVLDSIN